MSPDDHGVGTGLDCDEELVLTPGGLRPRDRVHLVRPGEVVEAGEDGTVRVVPREAAQERGTMAEELVLTPGGYRPRSAVHLIEPGHVVDGTDGRLKKVHESGRVVADFGLVEQRAQDRPLMPENVSLPAGPTPAFGQGWIAYTGWINSTGTPVSLFTTTWTVPPAPASTSGQVVFLFNGIQNSTMIYQPVLQWGVSGAGGGNYWGVASWYADGQGGTALHSSLVRVHPGDTLVGVMTLTGQSGGVFSYNCAFQGIANSSLTIQNVQQLTWCVETLEAYRITKCSDYPSVADTAFRAIGIQTGNTNPAVSWSPSNAVTDCGQRALVVSNSSTSGEVDLYYQTGWSGEEDLGGILSSAPTAASWSANRLDCFYRGQNNHMWHRWWDGFAWSGQEDLGGILTSNPAAVSWGPNRIDCFYRGQNNDMWHRWWDGSAWSGEEDLGGVLTSAPAAASWSASRLDCFYRGQNNHMWHRWWDGSAWSGEEDLGGVLTSSPAAVSWGPDRIDCFYRGQNNHMWHRWWDGSSWSGEEDLGGVLTSDPCVASWSANRLDCFYRGQNNHMWHRWWDGSAWSGEEDLGGILSSGSAAVSWGLGRIDCFYSGQNSHMWHRWYS